MTCRVTPGCMNPIENQDTGACASCGAAMRKAERMATSIIKRELEKRKEQRLPKQPREIKKVSKKMADLMVRYVQQKKKFLQGKFCAVFPDKPAITIHHMKGREGYADKWARDNDIPLLLDERYWFPASLEGHRFIEENRAWAEENGYTLSRSEKI